MKLSLLIWSTPLYTFREKKKYVGHISLLGAVPLRSTGNPIAALLGPFDCHWTCWVDSSIVHLALALKRVFQDRSEPGACGGEVSGSGCGPICPVQSCDPAHCHQQKGTGGRQPSSAAFCYCPSRMARVLEKTW